MGDEKAWSRFSQLCTKSVACACMHDARGSRGDGEMSADLLATHAFQRTKGLSILMGCDVMSCDVM